MTTNYTRQDAILPNLQRAGEAAIDAAMPLLRSHRPGLPTESRQGNAEEIGERDEAQGARSAATETYKVDRRGSENEVSAQANIGEADVKAVIAAGRSQHRATQRFARAAIYSAFPQAFERIAQAGLIDLSDFARRLIALGTQQQTST